MNNSTQAGGGAVPTDARLELNEDEHLPWLEAAGPVDDDPAVSGSRLALLVLAGLLLTAGIVGLMWWIQNGGGRGGVGSIIAAPSDPYKVQPQNPDAKVFEGEGDSSFAASEGKSPTGRIDVNRIPEEPTFTTFDKLASGEARPAGAAKAAAAPAPAANTPTTVATPPATTKAPAVAVAKVTPPAAPTPASPAPVKPAPAVPAPVVVGSGAMIQLGAFGTEASAAKAWTRLTDRFAYLKPLGRQIVPTKTASGTVYRLRATTSDAAAVCNRLKVAGESCMVVR